MIKHIKNEPCASDGAKPIYWFPDGKYLRRAEAPDALELPQPGEVGRQLSTDPLEEAGAIIDGECCKRAFVITQFGQFETRTTEHDLSFECKRYSTFVDDAIGELNALKNAGGIDQNRLVLAWRDSCCMIEEDADHLAEPPPRFREGTESLAFFFGDRALRP